MKKSINDRLFLQIFFLTLILGIGMYYCAGNASASDSGVIPSNLGITESDLTDIKVDQQTDCGRVNYGNQSVNKWFRIKNTEDKYMYCEVDPWIKTQIDKWEYEIYGYNVSVRVYNSEGKWVASYYNGSPSESGEFDGAGENSFFYVRPGETYYIQETGHMYGFKQHESAVFQLTVNKKREYRITDLELNKWNSDSCDLQTQGKGTIYRLTNTSDKPVRYYLDRKVQFNIGNIAGKIKQRYSAYVYNDIDFEKGSRACDYEEISRDSSGEVIKKWPTEESKVFEVKPNETVFISFSGMVESGSEGDRIDYSFRVIEYDNNSEIGEIEHSHRYGNWITTVEPTCDTAGERQMKCDGCDSIIKETIPAGHAWGKVIYEWSDDYSMVVAKRVCNRDAGHQEFEMARTTKKSVAKKADSSGKKSNQKDTSAADSKANNSEKEKSGTVGIKKNNPLKVKGKKITLKYSLIKIKAQTIKRSRILRINNAKGKMSYTINKVVKAKFKKHFKINKKTGQLIIKKGLKKGTYKLVLKIAAKGNKVFDRITKQTMVIIRIK